MMTDTGLAIDLESFKGTDAIQDGMIMRRGASL